MPRHPGLVLVALVLAMGSVTPAAADDLFYEPIPIQQAGSLLLDHENGQLIHDVVVDGDLVNIVTRDLDGVQTAIYDLPMQVLAMSEDSQIVWAHHRDGWEDMNAKLVALSATTFEELERIDVGAIWVDELVETGGKLVFTSGADGIYIYDLAVGGAPVVYDGGLGGDGYLAADPATPGRIAVVTKYPFTLAVLDVSGDNVVVEATRSFNGRTQGLAFSPDGSQVITGDGSVYRSSDLGNAGKYAGGGTLVAWSGDGTKLLLGSDLFEAGVYEPIWSAGVSGLQAVGVNHDGSLATFYAPEIGEPGHLYILRTDIQTGTIRGVVRDTLGEYAAFQRVEVYDESFNYLGEVVGTFDSYFWLNDIEARTYHLLFRNGDNPNVDEFFESWYGGAPVLLPQYSVPLVLEPGEDKYIIVEVRPHFVDVEDSVFREDVFWMADAGITAGCNPPISDLYCPEFAVTRGQMAAFLVRALGLTDRGDVGFTDDDFSIFEADIEKLATAGITKGCNPPFNTMFCPDDVVTRGQMAAFLHRALRADLTPGALVEFTDDDLSVFESDIEWLGSVGVTRGCNPPENTMFCPNEPVTRGQMAAFLRRALG